MTPCFIDNPNKLQNPPNFSITMLLSLTRYVSLDKLLSSSGFKILLLQNENQNTYFIGKLLALN